MRFYVLPLQCFRTEVASDSVENGTTEKKYEQWYNLGKEAKWQQNVQEEQEHVSKKACLEDKDGDACLAWADILKFKGDYKDALNVFKEQCDVYQSPMACLKAADMFRKDNYGTQDQPCAQEYYKKGCDKGHALGCFVSGFLLTSTKLIDQPRYQEALPFYEKGCDYLHDRACFMASEFYRRGVGTERDPVKAFEYASRACDLNHQYGCINASKMTADGDGIPQSTEVSEAFKEKLKSIMMKKLEERKEASQL